MADFYRLENNVNTYLDKDIDSTTTNIVVKKAVAPFNNPIIPNSDEIGVLTLVDNHESTTKIEIVHFENYIDNGNGTLTISGIVRGQENTTPKSFVKGSIVTQAITREAINAIINNIIDLKIDWEGSAANTISVTDIDNWNESFSWGDHSTYGYLTDLSSSTLDEISDIDTTGLSDNNIILYNSSTDSWEVVLFSHDQLQNIDSNEHIDWTLDQNGEKYINKNNIEIIDGGFF